MDGVSGSPLSLPLPGRVRFARDQPDGTLVDLKHVTDEVRVLFAERLGGRHEKNSTPLEAMGDDEGGHHRLAQARGEDDKGVAVPCLSIDVFLVAPRLDFFIPHQVGKHPDGYWSPSTVFSPLLRRLRIRVTSRVSVPARSRSLSVFVTSSPP